MAVCWIGIGANIGDARAAFDSAWRQLEQLSAISLQERSSLYQTNPVGEHAAHPFLNAVFGLSTTLSPLELLDVLQSVEVGLGRTREVRWGPRPIDLDLLYYDQITLNEPRLILPHPAAWYRQFVLVPMLEVAPAFRHPVFHETMDQLHARIMRRPLRVQCCESARSIVAASELQYRQQFPEVQFVTSIANADLGIRFEATEVICRFPIADLTATPGDPDRRVVDFLTSVFDQPHRVGDW